MRSWFNDFSATSSSHLAPTKLVPLSERIFLGFPLRLRNLLKAMINESVLKSPASSKWTAQVVKQVNPHLFFRASSFLNIHRPKIVHSSVCKRKLKSESAITGTLSLAFLLLQYRQSLTIFLASDFHWGIQDLLTPGAKACSLPTFRCFSWRSCTTRFGIGCDGGRITWCFASNCMVALLRRPPALTTPPRKIGCNGSSELLLGSAPLTWRSS